MLYSLLISHFKKNELHHWRTPNLQSNAFLQLKLKQIEPMSCHGGVIRKWHDNVQIFVSHGYTKISSNNSSKDIVKVGLKHKHYHRRNECVNSLTLRPMFHLQTTQIWQHDKHCLFSRNSSPPQYKESQLWWFGPWQWLIGHLSCCHRKHPSIAYP